MSASRRVRRQGASKYPDLLVDEETAESLRQASLAFPVADPEHAPTM